MAFKMSNPVKKAVNMSTGGLLGAAEAAQKGDLKGAVASGASGGMMDAKGFSKLGNTLSGTSEDAGILGVGQFKAKSAGINDGAFTNDQESEARQAAFAQQLAAANQRQASMVNPASVGTAAQATAATINQTPQAEFRTGQAGLAAALQAQAMGQGPSLAQSQLRQATDRNIAQSMAMAASQRGATAGQGLRQIAQQASAANQQAAQQSADLRMQEQMAARQQLGGVLASGREQDIGLATSQAGLQQQAGLANQSATNQFALAQADLTQGARLANQKAALEQTALNDAQSRFFNQGMADMEQRDRESLMALEKLKVDQNLGIQGINNQAYTATSQARGNLVGGLGQAAAMLSDETKKEDIEDGSTRTDKFLKGFSAALKSQSDDKGKNPWKGQEQTGKAIGKGLFALGKSFAGGGGGAAGPVSNMPQSGAVAAAPMMVAAHGLKVPGEAKYPGDDERNDTVPVMTSPGEVIVPRSAASDSDKLEAFVKALSTSEYKYKDEKYGKGVHVSPMAQELEKSELGRSMVTDTPEGKVVNYAKAGGLLLSTAAMLNDKVEDLDKRLAKALEKKRSA